MTTKYCQNPLQQSTAKKNNPPPPRTTKQTPPVRSENPNIKTMCCDNDGGEYFADPAVTIKYGRACVTTKYRKR